MAPLRPQQYRISWPLTPKGVEDIDTMFETLFKALRQASVTAAISVTTPVSTGGGLPGTMGPPGDMGEDGADGVPGARGATGATGSTGAQGPQGYTIQGNDGDDGQDAPVIPGPQGPKGDTGSSGSGAGIMGPPGQDGADGDDAWSVGLVNTPKGTSEFTVTTTGNIDDLDFSNASTIRMNNASLSTLRGLKAGVAGQQVTIVSVGTGKVDLAHANTGSGAGNRLLNYITSAATQ